MEIVIIIVSLLGGLALFLYGMGIMSSTLSNMTGGSLDRVIGKITKNRYVGFGVGTALTALVQSSSATTVLTVGFVNAGIMKLNEAFGFVVGANLGATMNAWILSLNSVEGGTFLLDLCRPSFFVPLFAFIAIIISAVAKTEKAKNISAAVIGFCVMMTGMMLMSDSIEPLKETPAFQGMLTSFRNPFIAFLAALAFTMVIQSSDATVGILQVIAMSGGLSYGMAIPLVCGAQVGTCMTAMLSSLGTSNNGRRTALLHLYFNIFKTIPFLLILFGADAIHNLEFLDGMVNGMWIPLFHTLINLAAALIYLPLSQMFVRLTELTIPYNEKEKQERENVLVMLDPMLLRNPPIALAQVRNALLKLSETIQETYDLFLNEAKNPESDDSRISSLCTRILRYRDQILGYIKEILAVNVSENKTYYIQCGQNICVFMGRIGELIQDMQDIRKDMVMKQMTFSDEANRDIQIFTEAVREIVDTTMLDFEMGNLALTESIGLFREAVSKLHGAVNSKHVKRLHDGICDMEAGMPFMDICYDLEKIIDSCDMVSQNLLPFRKAHQDHMKAEMSIEKRKEYIRHLYMDKYMEVMK